MKREELLRRYKEIRQKTVDICKPLQVEDYVVQPFSFVSPPKWHLGHTTWFFEAFIVRKLLGEKYISNEYYDLIFNSYYKGAGEHWQQSQRGDLSRPTVNEVIAYRSHVDEFVEKIIEDHSRFNSIKDVLIVGLNHEQQHQELLYMDIKSIYAQVPMGIVYDEGVNSLSVEENNNEWKVFKGRDVFIGPSEDEFFYDNESPKHLCHLSEFELRSGLVTQGEYLEFIEDGGYSQPRYWLSDGWDWVQKNNVSSPLYWQKNNDDLSIFTLRGIEKYNPKLPVSHISFYEAQAFANWKDYDLPTEFELEHYYKVSDKKDQLWCWTKSPYIAYPGFGSFKGVLGEYNGKFMCNQMVLRGGCLHTSDEHYRPSYRNFYRPYDRWQFSGLRLARRA